MHIFLYSILGIGFLFFLYFFFPYLYCRGLRFFLKRRMHDSKRVFFTFDDGPGQTLTPRILDALKDYDAPATFFVLGKKVKDHADLIRRIEQQGHQIGSHGYEHIHYWKVWPWESIADIRKGFLALDSVCTGPRRYCFRPPYGKVNLAVLIYLWIHRIPLVFWTFDFQDTWICDERPPESLPSLILRQGGAVVLAHDFERKDPDTEKKILTCMHLVLSETKGQLRPSRIDEFFG